VAVSRPVCSWFTAFFEVCVAGALLDELFLSVVILFEGWPGATALHARIEG
jgi:hypothetical protein